MTRSEFVVERANIQREERIEKRRARLHPDDVRLYHGPILIPDAVVAAAWHGPLDTHTGKKREIIICVESADLYGPYGLPSAVAHWRFRCAKGHNSSPIPSSHVMLGDIVKTQEGEYRVFCWRAVLEPRSVGIDCSPDVIILRKDPQAQA
jgi:hypothetical protein